MSKATVMPKVPFADWLPQDMLVCAKCHENAVRDPRGFNYGCQKCGLSKNITEITTDDFVMKNTLPR